MAHVFLSRICFWREKESPISTNHEIVSPQKKNEAGVFIFQTITSSFLVSMQISGGVKNIGKNSTWPVRHPCTRLSKRLTLSWRKKTREETMESLQLNMCFMCELDDGFTKDYTSSHNHGSQKWAPPIGSLPFNCPAIFHRTHGFMGTADIFSKRSRKQTSSSKTSNGPNQVQKLPSQNLQVSFLNEMSFFFQGTIRV